MWILDESSYRIDKTNFPNREEAEQKAGEAARILGRPISVYQLLKGELIFDFKVLPDGSISKNDSTIEPVKDETVKNPPSTPILGSPEQLKTPYWHNHDYRHYLRDLHAHDPKKYQDLKKALEKAGLDPMGSSPQHEAIIEKFVGTKVQSSATPILGKRELLDDVAAVLEKAGRMDLSALVDAEHEVTANPRDSIKMLTVFPRMDGSYGVGLGGGGEHAKLSPQFKDDREVQKLFHARFKYFDDAHDAAQKIFRHAMVTHGSVKVGGAVSIAAELLQAADDMSTFSPKQLDELKRRFGAINKIDPASPTYQKMIKMLDGMDQRMLKHVADSGIKFVSMLARNRLK